MWCSSGVIIYGWNSPETNFQLAVHWPGLCSSKIEKKIGASEYETNAPKNSVQHVKWNRKMQMFVLGARFCE